jgi:hypothetical protein
VLCSAVLLPQAASLNCVLESKRQLASPKLQYSSILSRSL